MINSKQRALLRSMAASEHVIVTVGKEGITDSVVDSMLEALSARELVKGKVLESSLLTAREACNELAQRCKADGVQTIGSIFVLYKRNEKKPRIDIKVSK
ncbi:MAG: YhbY family RNA-binding protein [Oscillospiraceae bacterium]|nr:YhbY family RNA-binding protein [Oscillospiraceae bacterium]